MTLFSDFSKNKKTCKGIRFIRMKVVHLHHYKSLIDKGILEEYHIQIDRVQYSGEETEATKRLNDYQKEH